MKNQKSYKLANLKRNWCIAPDVVLPCGTTFRLGEKIVDSGEVYYKCYTSFLPNEENCVGFVNKAVLQFI